MAEVRDVVAPNFGALKKAVCISEVSAVQKYENGERTGEVAGYKATFLITEGLGEGLQIVVKLPVLEKPQWELMVPYEITYDTEKSTVYLQNGRMALSLWAKSVDA